MSFLDGTTAWLLAGIAFGGLGVIAKTDGSALADGVRAGLQACGLTLLIMAAGSWAIAHLAFR